MIHEQGVQEKRIEKHLDTYIIAIIPFHHDATIWQDVSYDCYNIKWSKKGFRDSAREAKQNLKLKYPNYNIYVITEKKYYKIWTIDNEDGICGYLIIKIYNKNNGNTK